MHRPIATILGDVAEEKGANPCFAYVVELCTLRLRIIEKVALDLYCDDGLTHLRTSAPLVDDTEVEPIGELVEDIRVDGLREGLIASVDDPEGGFLDQTIDGTSLLLLELRERLDGTVLLAAT